MECYCAPRQHYNLHLNFSIFVRRAVHLPSKQTLIHLACRAAQFWVQSPFSRILDRHLKLVVGKCHVVCRARVRMRTCWTPARRTGMARGSCRGSWAAARTRTVDRRCCGGRRGCAGPARCRWPGARPRAAWARRAHPALGAGSPAAHSPIRARRHSSSGAQSRTIGR